MQRWMLAMCAATLVVAVVSCGANQQTSTTDQTGSPPANTEAAPVEVAAIELGKSVGPDHRVTEQITVFAPGEPLHASVVTNGAAPSAEIRAVWYDANGNVVDESTRTVSPAEAPATEFTLAKSDLPVGNYRIEIFLNGAPAGSREFEVKSS
jgi:hypothetical protein